MVCFYCKMVIEDPATECWNIGLDRPVRIDIPVHKKPCLAEIESYGTDKYLQDNASRVYAFADKEQDPKTKKKRK